MQRHRVLGGITFIVGAFSIATSVVNITLFGQPLLHWVTLLNLLIETALVAGGILLWTGRKNRYAISLLAWGLTAITAAIELVLLFWTSSHGGTVYPSRIMLQTGYFAGGILAIVFLLKQLQGTVEANGNGMSA